jgi:S-adenosylmethionine:tRNA ribosyltransferase-isomerase
MPKTEEFDYALPPESIAQEPLEQRDASRLLVLQRKSGQIFHRKFSDIAEYLEQGDVLVVNDSRVIPARLHGRKIETKGRVEFLLLERVGDEIWRVLVGGKRVVTGSRIQLTDKLGNETDIVAEVVATGNGAIRDVVFSQPTASFLNELGDTPLPPYIREELRNGERYQTIYARPEGSAAAPTAGLHFTPDLMLQLREKGVIIERVTLHIGLDTFKPVESAEVSQHEIHSEWTRMSFDSARRINQAILAGGRVIAVGTTSVRVLESAALRSAEVTGPLAKISGRDALTLDMDYCPWRPVAAYEGRTDLFIYPGYRYRVVDAMVTNFHLPKSSLLMLVSSFAGREQILSTYNKAIKEGYRFYSFGDAMLIL